MSRRAVGRKVAFKRVVEVGVVAEFILFACAMSPAYAQRGPAVVETVQAEQRRVTPKQAILGTIVPTNRAVIGSAVDGRVVEFKVRVGDRVEKDEALASLLDQTISLEIESAEAELKLRGEELSELENGSLPEEIAQAKARLDASRIAAEYLEKNKQRFVDLGDTRAISVSEYENAISTWLEADQRYQEAKAAYQLAIDGPRREKIAQAKAREAMQKAVVEKLKDQKIKHTMFSRFAGYVTVEHTEVGQWLPRGEPVAEIIAIDEVDVLAKVPEAYIPFIHVGDEVEVVVPALPQMKRKLAGNVHAIVPEADERSRTFPVKVRITNEMNPQGEMLLKAGMLAQAILASAEPADVLVVPKDALVLDGELTSVWIIDRDSIAKSSTAPGSMEANAISVAVHQGIEDGAWIGITPKREADADKLSVETRVVVRGNERIPASRPGAPPSRVTWTEKQ